MSTAVICYSRLANASSEAKGVASKLESYESGLNSSVYRKLSAYGGSCTANVTLAKTQVNAKMSELSSRAEAFAAYAEDLSELREQCRSVDQTVKTRVLQLTADFKAVHDINNNAAINIINYLLTSIENRTFVGRFLSNLEDRIFAFDDYITQSLAFWWDYEGGEEVITGMAIGASSVVLGVCAVITAVPVLTAGIAALAAGGSILVVVTAAAGLVSGAIALVNGVVDLVNEGRAYLETSVNEDPALGQRRSGENTLQSVLRTETDSALLHAAALGLDIANAVCSVVSAVSNIGTQMETAGKWLSGSTVDTIGLEWKELLTIDHLKLIFSNAVSPLTDLGESIAVGDYRAVITYFSYEGSDFFNALTQKFIGSTSVRTVKNWGSLVKTLVSGNFKLYSTLTSEESSVSDAVLSLAQDSLLNTLIWSNLEIGNYITVTSDGYSVGSITAGNVTGTINSVTGIASSAASLYTELFTDTSLLGEDLLEKLSEISDIKISIPETYVPDTETDAGSPYAAAA